MHRSILRHPWARYARYVFQATLLLMLWATMPASAAVYTVGDRAIDPACHFANLQEAVNETAQAPGEDTIRIAYEPNWNAQQVSIGQQDLTVEGGYSNCWAAVNGWFESDKHTVLSGAGGANAPVITVTGSGVRVLRNLMLILGDNPSGGGGGIRYTGSGVVQLENAIIANNTALDGGGIYMRTPGAAHLVIGEGTWISSNHAIRDGGGIHATRSAHVRMEQPNATLVLNQAPSGRGGGLFLEEPASAFITSPGVPFWPATFQSNSAAHGGAIAAVSASDSGWAFGAAYVTLFGRHAAGPVRLADNEAEFLGGAIYASGTLVGNSTVHLRLDNFVIEGNTAGDGAAIYARRISEPNTGENEAPGELKLGFHLDGNESLHCPPGGRCNLIERNHAHAGAVVSLNDHVLAEATGLHLRDSSGTNLLRVIDGSGAETSMYLRNSLIEGNTTDESMGAVSGARGALDITHSTIAGNVLQSSVFLFEATNVDSGFALFHSIIDQPGVTPLVHPGGSSDPDVASGYNIGIPGQSASDLTSLAVSPRFVDPAYRDYRLRPGSLAVDFAPAESWAPAIDLDNQARNLDLETANSLSHGPSDVGAYELQAIDNLVMNGDFVSDLRAWEPLEPGVLALDPYDVSGSYQQAGRNSIRVFANSPAPSDLIHGARQCIPLPSPGAYRLHARAFTGGGLADIADVPTVEWVLRKDSETCDGSVVQASGLLQFAEGEQAWRRPLSRPMIVVPSHLWGSNTSIELRLKVSKATGQPTAQNLYALFDDLHLTRYPEDTIFVDGHEDP